MVAQRDRSRWLVVLRAPVDEQLRRFEQEREA
jgi:hypothetical protein